MRWYKWFLPCFLFLTSPCYGQFGIVSEDRRISAEAETSDLSRDARSAIAAAMQPFDNSVTATRETVQGPHRVTASQRSSVSEFEIFATGTTDDFRRVQFHPTPIGLSRFAIEFSVDRPIEVRLEYDLFDPGLVVRNQGFSMRAGDASLSLTGPGLSRTIAANQEIVEVDPINDYILEPDGTPSREMAPWHPLMFHHTADEIISLTPGRYSLVAEALATGVDHHAYVDASYSVRISAPFQTPEPASWIIVLIAIVIVSCCRRAG